jgi:putative transposase
VLGSPLNQGDDPGAGTSVGLTESFFATLECELIDRRIWQSETEARLALFTYIEGRYNSRRRHSALGQTSPAAFEQRFPRIPTVGVCVAGATPPVDSLVPRPWLSP